MTARHLHIVHLVIRREHYGKVEFLLLPHDKWKDPSGQPYLTLPTKKTVSDPLAPFLQGTSIEAHVDDIARNDLGLAHQAYAIELEIEPTRVMMESPTTGESTEYTIYPIDVWVDLRERTALGERLNGVWLSCDGA